PCRSSTSIVDRMTAAPCTTLLAQESAAKPASTSPSTTLAGDWVQPGFSVIVAPGWYSPISRSPKSRSASASRSFTSANASRGSSRPCTLTSPQATSTGPARLTPSPWARSVGSVDPSVVPRVVGPSSGRRRGVQVAVLRDHERLAQQQHHRRADAAAQGRAQDVERVEDAGRAHVDHLAAQGVVAEVAVARLDGL